MRWSRYFLSKRYISVAQYLVFLAVLYFIYCVLSNRGNDTLREENPILAQQPALQPNLHDLRAREEAIEKYEKNQEVAKVNRGENDDWEQYKGHSKKDWLDRVVYESDLKRVGPGEQGKPVSVPKDEASQAEALALYKANGYNAYVSDMISLDRAIKDIRHPNCMKMEYSSKLPTVSVIFPFHEEHNSTLIRSVWTILNRSPPGLIKEVILVDDCSEKPFLLKPLEDFWQRNKLDHVVKVLRNKKREGLIRARQFGAEIATGEVLIFLDAHSEANYNWLPPLLDPIIEDYRTVVCPFVDVIDCETYEVRPQDEGARGSFDWVFNYKRLPITQMDRKNPTKPFNSPVMAGGYFAISRKWFWELGGYDMGLDIWGGEQYELSFKVWQCHGRMVDAPCSRVAHIYRCKYQPFKSAVGKGDFISRNYKRVAEVWMDEYKEILYKNRPGVREVATGDLTEQKAVRERLQCKSFDWFMKEIAFDQDRYYPSVDPPPSTHGELRHAASGLCVDAQFKGQNQRIPLRKCISEDPNGGGEQDLRLTRWHDIRPKGRRICFDASQSGDKAPVVLFDCHSMKGNQLFKLRVEKKQIFHPVSAQCLAADSTGEGNLYTLRCDESDSKQQWTWQVIDDKLLRERQEEEVKEGDL
ncbi:unnamed protein product, partial [Mesorhabditis belari]|uniref:Polypeptide N-acetylgalactosaminyltransferase n=1 Tax=Mesorhabditis belari TaxID=2138241 RepID=A0AAF3FHV3_9BILA